MSAVLTLHSNLPSQLTTEGAGVREGKGVGRFGTRGGRGLEGFLAGGVGGGGGGKGGGLEGGGKMWGGGGRGGGGGEGWGGGGVGGGGGGGVEMCEGWREWSRLVGVREKGCKGIILSICRLKDKGLGWGRRRR